MSDALRSRLSAALRSHRDAHAKTDCQKRWVGETAEALNIGERTLKEWLYGESLPSFESGLALFDLFGPEFESQVRGRAYRSVADKLQALNEGGK